MGNRTIKRNYTNPTREEVKLIAEYMKTIDMYRYTAEMGKVFGARLERFSVEKPKG